MKRGVVRKLRQAGSVLRRGAMKGKTLAGKANRALGGLPGDILKSAVVQYGVGALL